jgi:hypothetical protein
MAPALFSGHALFSEIKGQPTCDIFGSATHCMCHYVCTACNPIGKVGAVYPHCYSKHLVHMHVLTHTYLPVSAKRARGAAGPDTG